MIKKKNNIKQLSIFDIELEKTSFYEESTDNLILDNQNLIYKVLKDLHLSHKADEYFDVGMIALVKTVKKGKYNKEKSSFSHYLYTSIYYAILNQLDIEKKEVSILDKKDLDEILNLKTKNELVDSYDLESHVEAKVMLEQILIYLAAIYPEKHVEIFKKKYGINCFPMYFEEIASAYNYSLTTLRRLIKKMETSVKENFHPITEGENL